MTIFGWVALAFLLTKLICQSLRTFNEPLSPFLFRPRYHLAVTIVRRNIADLIVKAMGIARTKVIPERSPQVSSPIQYVTENGFSITRLREIDDSVIDRARECHFLVRNQRGWEREVTVHFDEDLIAQIQNQRRSHLLDTSFLWLICAEQCLGRYLWEKDNFPDGGRLNIGEVSVDELLLATHWSDQQGD